MLPLDSLCGPVRSGSLSKNIEISVTDLRYEMEKYGIRDQIDKSSFASILTLFTKYQLLQVIGKLGEEDCRICLYPSMQFVLEPQEFGKFVEKCQPADAGKVEP